MNSSNRYFSTFTSGFEPIVGDLLKQSLKGVEVDLLLNGLIVYSTNSALEKVKKINFFTNSFLLLRSFSDSKAVTIEKMMIAVSKNRIRFAPRFPLNSRTFRVVTSKENQPVLVSPKMMADIERQISKSLGLKPDRSKPQVQFWFLTRSEGYGFFGLRITQHPDYAKVLEKGELRPELANMLCRLSEPDKNDVFLDPFAGSGSIVRARVKFPFTKIYARDISPKDRNIQKMDATKLEGFEDESVDKIVTDPPWGFFDNKVDIPTLYDKFLVSSYRVLKTGGIIIILVGDRDFFENLLTKFTDKFILQRKFHILVSGKQAGVYKLIKNR